jgi:biotin carboxyl carrier protein
VKYHVRIEDRIYTVDVSHELQSFRVELDRTLHRLQIVPDLGSTDFRVWIDGTGHRVIVRRDEEAMRIEIGEDRYQVRVERAFPVPASQANAIASPRSIEVKATMPGLVVAVEAISGAWVDQGHPVVVMEAMKMQMEIRAPIGGRILAVRVKAGQEVPSHDVLVTLDPTPSAPGAGSRAPDDSLM